MLESMLPPDTMKKIMVYMMGSVFAILAFVGMVMIVYTALTPTFQAHLWPALLGLGCAGAWFAAKGKGSKMGLACIAFLAALWILLNSIMCWIDPPRGLTALSATGAFLIVFGSLAGIMGATK